MNIQPGSRTEAFYGATISSEQYYCNFGLNPAYQKILNDRGLKIVGTDASGEARIMELPNHPFFVATLFVPPLSSTAERPHPLVLAFVRAALARAAQRTR